MKRNKLTTTFLTATLSLALNSAHAESLGSYERSLASETEYSHAIQPALGFNRGQLVVNADYEYRVSEHFGFGGNLYYTPDDNSSNYAEIIGVHAQAKIHAPLGDLDFYAKPGLGVAKVETRIAGVDEDSTLLSPLFGIGVMYRIGDNFGIGVEHLTLFNWTDDDFFGTKDDFLLAAQIRF